MTGCNNVAMPMRHGARNAYQQQKGHSPATMGCMESIPTSISNLTVPHIVSSKEESVIEEDLHSLYIESESNGSVCGVYNEISNKMEWKRGEKEGIAGVYNPLNKTVEWKTKYNNSVAGVYNPISQKVEWQEEWHGGVAGVYNPVLQKVEWYRKKHHGVGGVWNPSTNKVEWEEEWNGGVAGYFDYDRNEVVWHRKWRHGMCIVTRDPKTDQYITCTSSITDWWEV